MSPLFCSGSFANTEMEIINQAYQHNQPEKIIVVWREKIGEIVQPLKNGDQPQLEFFSFFVKFMN